MTNEQTKHKPHPYSHVLQWVAEGKEIEVNTGTYQGKTEWSRSTTSEVLYSAEHGVLNKCIFQPEHFRLKPERHIHQELIDAYNKGAEIQYWSCLDANGCYYWRDIQQPAWSVTDKYRIKPKEITAQYAYVVLLENGSIDISHWTNTPTRIDNLKVVFDGETNKIKSVEIIENKHD